MRILVLLPEVYSRKGGIQTYNKCLINALYEISRKGNYSLTVHILNDQKKDLETDLFINKNIISLKAFNQNKIVFALLTIYEIFSSDIIIFGHINFLPITRVAYAIKRHFKSYLIVHGIDAWKRLKNSDIKTLLRINNILSVSNFTKDELCKFNPLNKERVLILSNTLDPEFEYNYKDTKSVSVTREKLSLPHGKMILTVSRLQKVDSYKNIDLLIKALPEIVEEIPDTFYVIIGRGDDTERLKQIAKYYRMDKKVIFKEDVELNNLLSFYNTCDLFVLPSLKEGFGIVFLEAMYFSKACIGADAGGIPEVIKNGETGILCNPNNIRELSLAVIKLLKDDKLRAEMGKSGKKRLEEYFSFEMFKKNLEKILLQ